MSDRIPERYRLSSYDYELPPDLIAQVPAPARDESRLLCIDGPARAHRRFSELPDALHPGDVIVLNETRVVPAMVKAEKPSGAETELLVLDPAIAVSAADEHAVRICIAKRPERLVRAGSLALERGGRIEIIETCGAGLIRVRFPCPESAFLDFLDIHGAPPLPPYIARGSRNLEEDRSRYQTVYSRRPGSIAAPTAGLHFTESLLSALERAGFEFVRITLHVGFGTFNPVRVEDVRDHRMHSETYEITPEACRTLNEAVGSGRRIVAVGTTVLRTLEHAADERGFVTASSAATDLFIIPGYYFKVARAVITNFHLPKSTLFMLTCAFGGVEHVRAAYAEAIEKRYRFFSYGDASLITRND